MHARSLIAALAVFPLAAVASAAFAQSPMIPLINQDFVSASLFKLAASALPLTPEEQRQVDEISKDLEVVIRSSIAQPPTRPPTPPTARPGAPVQVQPTTTPPPNVPVRTPPPPPPPPATTPHPERPPTITAADPDIKKCLATLIGCYKAPAEGNQPALLFSSAIINIEGLDNAAYFEIAREDSAAYPFRNGVISLYRHQNELRLRIYDFRDPSLEPGFSAAVAGLWAAPEVFPTLNAAQLSINAELTVQLTDTGFVATTPNPAPLNPATAAGAVEYLSNIIATGPTLSIADRGMDASGKVVWGPAPGATTAFTRFTPAVKVNHLADGLVTIDLVSAPATAPKAVADGTEVAIAYTGWTTDGYQFDSSHNPGREPIAIKFPVALIKGWNLGIPGIAQGTIRKLVIPGPLAYEHGNSRAHIAPGATLIFLAECVYLKLPDPNAPTPPTTPPAPPMPAPKPGAAPAPAAAPAAQTK